jgi:hypothetical protein
VVSQVLWHSIPSLAFVAQQSDRAIKTRIAVPLLLRNSWARLEGLKLGTKLP